MISNRTFFFVIQAQESHANLEFSEHYKLICGIFRSSGAIKIASGRYHHV
jgi:hypothetical protein